MSRALMSAPVNALGERKTATDRNGNVHTYSYDVVGRFLTDAVTTLGSGVEGSVRRQEVAYDSAGLAFRFTTYDAASGGSVVDQFVPKHSGGLKEPQSLVFGPHDHDLYVGSGHFGGPLKAVLRYDGTTGAFLDEFTESGHLQSVHGEEMGTQLFSGYWRWKMNCVLFSSPLWNAEPHRRS